MNTTLKALDYFSWDPAGFLDLPNSDSSESPVSSDSDSSDSPVPLVPLVPLVSRFKRKNYTAPTATSEEEEEDDDEFAVARPSYKRVAVAYYESLKDDFADSLCQLHTARKEIASLQAEVNVVRKEFATEVAKAAKTAAQAAREIADLESCNSRIRSIRAKNA